MIIQLRPSVQGNIQICQPEGEVDFPRACQKENNPPGVDKSGCFPTQRAVIVLLYFCQCFIGYLPCGGKSGCSAGYNKQLRPSVQGNIQICQTEGENNPSRVDKSGCFHIQRAVIDLLYFCQCFIGYLPCGGQLGCSAENNKVISRQRKCLPMFYRLSPLWGKTWLFGGEQ